MIIFTAWFTVGNRELVLTLFKPHINYNLSELLEVRTSHWKEC